jgi:small subunit ribosomal protein S17
MTTEQKKRGIRKSQVGVVTSTAMQKTVTVAVDRLVQHPLYKKTLRRTSKFLAHDEQGACKVGDRVRIVETRPLSARKRWRVEKILVKAT